MSLRGACAAACVIGLLGAQQPQQPQQPPPPPPVTADAAAARAGADRAYAALIAMQRADGALGSGVLETQFEYGFSVATFYAWQVAAHSLATVALLDAPPTPERTQALERAVRWLCTTEMCERGSDWDNDAVWGWIYGTVATTRLAGEKRFQTDEWRLPIQQRGRQFVARLTANQVPEGGFGYYDDPTFTRRPKWATSFSTSAVLPALSVALRLGWADEELGKRAASYIRHCRLPNGAYSYDLTPIPRLNGGEHINDVKGSLGRIQCSHWALHRFGDAEITAERLRWGVAQFFEHHRFLLVARRRPVPHEAYYANAAYFYFFGHYYLAQCIELLPEAEREQWHARLRPLILQTQQRDGSFNDFHETSQMTVASTAFAAMALESGIR